MSAAPSIDWILREAVGDDWPAPMRSEAFIGLPGQFVEVVEPHTESDRHGLLLQFLAAAGNMCGRTAGVMTDGAFHSTVVWPALIGQTAKARKGTSWSRTRELLVLACPDWESRIVGGMSTGEGLAYQIRDERRQRRKPRRDETPGDDGMVEEVADAGVHDKRLCVVETEFASVFKVMKRDTNTLSTNLRTLWDFGGAGGLTKSEPTRVSRGHVTVIAHCTLDELLTVISEVDVSNGLLNRFVFACVRRAQELPDGGFVPVAETERLAELLATVVRGAAKIQQPLERTGEARELWHARYSELSRDRPGRLGAILSRAEAQVLRLSLVYAVLDGRDEIDVEHLRAALAVWDYCAESAAYVFGDSTGNELADRIRGALRRTPAGLTRTQIRDLVGGRVTEQQLQAALQLLLRQRLATWTVETDTGGRPAERWFATTPDDKEKR